MSDPHDYTITVKRVREDNTDVFRATVRELPHVQAYGDTYAEAYEIAIDAIEGLQELAAEDGAPFPEPNKEENIEWSGRVTLRLPKSLHRRASVVADEEGVSFNQFLVSIIAEAVGEKSAERMKQTRIENIVLFPSENVFRVVGNWDRKAVAAAVAPDERFGHPQTLSISSMMTN